jgi:hypothetical protein
MGNSLKTAKCHKIKILHAIVESSLSTWPYQWTVRALALDQPAPRAGTVDETLKMMFCRRRPHQYSAAGGAAVHFPGAGSLLANSDEGMGQG